MTERDIQEMQRRIDEGIQLAHKRLWRRAGILQQTLVVTRDGEILEMVPSEDGSSEASSEGKECLSGNPLVRRVKFNT